MSGSTVIRQRGRSYELRLETPSVSFAYVPTAPGEPTAEQRYHADAERRFRDQLAPLAGALDDALDALARDLGIVLIPLDDRLPLARAYGEPPPGPCRWESIVDAPPPAVWTGLATITLASEALPDAATRARIVAAIAEAIAAIVGAHAQREQERRERERRGAAPEQPPAPAPGGRRRRARLLAIAATLALLGAAAATWWAC